MKCKIAIFKVTFFIFFTGIFIGNSQQTTPGYLLEAMSVISSEEALPFWLHSNRQGAVPNSNALIINTALYADFGNKNNDFDVSYKVSLTGYTATTNKLFINELYVGLRHKKLQLDLGVRHPEILWNGLSSSNGNIVLSNNARAFPGYYFQLIDFVPLPFAKNWLSVKASYGDFLMNDPRVVDGTRLHRKSLVFKTVLSSRLEMLTGLYHFAQWGGTSPVFGKQPTGFKNYLKIVTGSSGGSDATGGDQINVLGNHLGTYLLQFNYIGKQHNWNFYWSHPFEDRSGRELANFPDGLYGLFIDFKNPNALVTQLLTEFTYTKNMSGGDPHYTDKYGVVHSARGRDDYFNSTVYESGWTYFGNVIGAPYFTTKPVDENGHTRGVIQGDNRFMAFNVGIRGSIAAIQYKAILSHITYFGWFEEEYDPRPKQFSGLLELRFSEGKTLPFDLTVGTAFDTGSYRPTNFGGFLKLSKTGIF